MKDLLPLADMDKELFIRSQYLYKKSRNSAKT